MKPIAPNVIEQLHALGGRVEPVCPEDDGSELLPEDTRAYLENESEPGTPCEHAESYRCGWKVYFEVPPFPEIDFPPLGFTAEEYMRLWSAKTLAKAFDTAEFGNYHLSLLGRVPDLTVVDFSDSSVTPYAASDFANLNPTVTVKMHWKIGVDDISGLNWPIVHTNACDIYFCDERADSTGLSVASWSPSEEIPVDDQARIGAHGRLEFRFQSDGRLLTVTHAEDMVEIQAQGEWVKHKNQTFSLKGGKKLFAIQNGIMSEVTD